MSDMSWIHKIELCLQSVRTTSTAYLKQLMSDRCISIKYQNKHNFITQKMQKIKSNVSKLYLESQHITYIHSELTNDAVVVFGKSFTHVNIIELTHQIKQNQQELRRLHQMKMQIMSDNQSTGLIGSYVVNISKYTYIPECNFQRADISDLIDSHHELTEEPVSYGRYSINHNNSQNKLSKILTIASINDIEVFEFIRQNTAEMLRLDIVWDERKCMLKKRLEKLNYKIKTITKSIQINTAKYNNLKYKLESLPIPKHSSFDPVYIQQIRNKCKKLEYGLKIVDDYKKIEEFVIWVSEYGRQNPTDLDILDGVQHVINQSNEQIQILHNQLIGIRNYCEIQNVGIF